MAAFTWTRLGSKWVQVKFGVTPDLKPRIGDLAYMEL